MVVYDLDILCACQRPTEYDPILLVDPNAVESLAITLERLEAIRRRDMQ
jgi:hypothetical protein